MGRKVSSMCMMNELQGSSNEKDKNVEVPKSSNTNLSAAEKSIEELNIQAYEDLILSINTSTDPGKVAL